MTLPDQVTSLESSKKLKALGVPQVAMFQYCCHAITGGQDYVHIVFDGQGLTSCGVQYLKIAAFTVAELGEFLPQVVNPKNELKYILVCGKVYNTEWQCGYRRNGITLAYFNEMTEAEARAKMLIYLLENNLMKIGE